MFIHLTIVGCQIQTDVTGDVSYKTPICSIYLKKDSE